MPSYARVWVAAVTSGAKRSVSGAKGGDLVLAAIVRGVVDAGVRFGGIERGALLAQIGLVEGELHDPDGLVPFEGYVRAWEVLASDPDNERLGLRLGELSSPAFLGALGYAMVHAPDGLAAIQLFRRYRQLVSDTLAPHIDFEDEHVVYHLVWPARVARIVHFADCAFVGMVALLRSLMELPADVPLLSEAWYQCPEPTGFDREAALGCRVRFAAPETRAVLRRAPLSRALPRHDPLLFGYLERHAKAVLDRIPSEGGLADRVARLITEGLRGGEPAQADVARKLLLSERTLQRRLREADTSFASILDNVRRQLSELYLSDPAVAIHEVAFLLGYSEPSAFHRAFRRWTGETPHGFRQRQSPAR